MLSLLVLVTCCCYSHSFCLLPCLYSRLDVAVLESLLNSVEDIVIAASEMNFLVTSDLLLNVVWKLKLILSHSPSILYYWYLYTHRLSAPLIRFSIADVIRLTNVMTTRVRLRLSVCLSVCNDCALTFEILDLETSFWCAGTSWEYLARFRISRSFGQGQGHRGIKAIRGWSACDWNSVLLLILLSLLLSRFTFLLCLRDRDCNMCAYVRVYLSVCLCVYCWQRHVV